MANLVVGIVVIVIGGLASLMGLLGLYAGILGLRLEYIVGKPWRPVREVKRRGVTHVLGRVRACDEVVLRAPATGREVVWYRTRLERRGYKGSRQVLWMETRSCRFELEDEAGDRALVDPDSAVVLVDDRRVGGAGAAEFIRAHGSPEGEVLVIEEVLAVGDRVHAIGPSRPCEDAPRSTPVPYRGADGPIVVMRSRKRFSSLVLTTSDHAKPNKDGPADSAGRTLAVGAACCVLAPFIFAQAPRFLSAPSTPSAAAHPAATLSTPSEAPGRNAGAKSDGGW